MRHRGSFLLEITLTIVNLMMQYRNVVLAVPVACPGGCSCGTIFGERPFVRCSNLHSQDIYKVVTDIPENTEEIKMTNTSLTQLYQLQGNFPKLRYLFIRNCSMSKFEDTLRSFLSTSKKIYSISVTFNNINTVQGNPFQGLVTLQQLDLCHNGILLINESAFSSTPNLRILKLCHNRLSSLEKNLFASNAELTSLYLENNDFETFPLKALKTLKKLQHLDLSSNNIYKIPVLSALSSLKFLYLSDNRISVIESHAFEDLHYLSVLWLSRNKITALPEDMALIFHLMDFSRIILDDNPFTCDCRNRWLISWQKSICNQDNRSRGCYLTCSEKGTSVSMTQVDFDNLKCECGSSCFCRAENLKACQVNCQSVPALNEARSQKCSQCPIGSLPLFDGSSTCVCQAGYTMDKGVCTKCPEGTYKSSIGPAICAPCPQYSTSRNGSTAAEHCICRHGELSVLSDERKCQSYENEEVVRLGLGPVASREERLSRRYPSLPGFEPLVTTTPVKHDKVTEYKTVVKKSDNVIFGVVGVVMSVFLVGVGFALYRWKKNNQTEFGLPQKLAFQSTCQNEERHGSLIYSTKLENYYKGLEVTSNQLKIGKLIGRGAFGKVYEGFLHNTKDNDVVKVAIKRLKEDSSREDNEALQLEVEHMIYVGKHPNIIQLFGVCSIKGLVAGVTGQQRMLTPPMASNPVFAFVGGSLMLVLEYASNGDLLSYLRRYSTLSSLQLTSPGFGHDRAAVEIFRTLVMFTWHVAKGMCHLEKLKCIHRDLAARNILLTLDPIAKISDFGLSRDVYESAYYFKVSKGRLPFKWMSPEALLMGQYSIKSDVWSFGILLWEVVTLGGNPYAGIPVEALCELYAKNYRLPKPASCPNSMYRLMQDCWGELTNNRPSFIDIEARLDNLLQYVANRDYTDLMEKDTTPLSIDNYNTVDITGHITMSSFCDTDSDDRTYEETSDSDTYQEPELNYRETGLHCQETDLTSELLPCRSSRYHLSQMSPRGRTEGRHLEAEAGVNAAIDGVCNLQKSTSSIELQNLCDYKVKMWSNPIYGSSRQLKETSCTLNMKRTK